MESEQEIERYHFERFRGAAGLDVNPADGDKPEAAHENSAFAGVAIRGFSVSWRRMCSRRSFAD
jgi:hypothetical protein